MTRSIRRFHRKRLIQKRIGYVVNQNIDLEECTVRFKRIGIMVNTPKPCSCAMCGNPRKFENALSRQEIISNLNFKAQISELGN